ncbi:MBL fold metallo-hydrolase [Streptomyces sp. NBC_01283]|uniref:MBL fold metallo-hydrolase n=1 Tax=Streptomyces sp. NBC_01283 TaxID=2903812 RepID=UPI00352DFB83|nr:MBL fold metallo-hydrolase [Streptomyces sp. NBC_01283]
MRSHRPDVSAHGTTDSCRLRPQWSENLRHRTRQSIGALLIEHGERALLIDAGFGPQTLEAEPGSPIGALHGGELLDNLARVGRRPQDIEAVAITHLHGDHVGWLSHPPPRQRSACLPAGQIPAHGTGVGCA